MHTLRTIASIVALGAALSLHATTFDVTTLTDGGPGSLRQAILDANATFGDDTITFSVSGTITLGTNLPAITDHTAIIGPGTNLLTISGSNKFRVFHLVKDTTNSLSDLTIADGFATLDPSIRGGRTNASGVSNEGWLTMQRCVIEKCRTYGSKGVGVYNGGYLDMQSCIVKDCVPQISSAEVMGGAVFNGGTAKLIDCVLLRCKGSQNGPTGGGIYNTNGASLFLLRTRIESSQPGHNFADGGGLANRGNAVLDTCIITACVGYWAGGIWNNGSIAATNTSIIGNYSQRGGGALNFGEMILERCTVYWNAAGAGGGVINLGNLKLINSTVSQNSSSDGGAGISDKLFISYIPTLGTTYLNHCTIISNTGPSQVTAEGFFTLESSILSECTGMVNSVGHNLILSTNNLVVTNDVTGNIYNVNPMLGPLQNNGGATWTHALLPGSTAIDNGNGGLTTDQRGAVRSSPSDIGAYELVAVTPPDLHIARTAPTQVTVSWASTPAPLVLQQNTNLSGIIWSDINIVPATDGTNTSVTLPTDASSKLFRLRSP